MLRITLNDSLRALLFSAIVPLPYKAAKCKGVLSPRSLAWGLNPLESKKPTIFVCPN